MQVLSKEVFNELANYRSETCISIFLPTHRGGMEVNRREDEILFKNQLKELPAQLEARGFSVREIEDFLQPAYALLNDTTFWHRASDGLAVFIGERFFRQFILPDHFEPFIYLADHFYLKPLMPILNDDRHFFLLSLSLEEVRFFESTQHSIKELHVADLTPGELKEVVGYDYEEKSLQFHSAQGGAGRAVYHGHGRATDKDKDEIEQFLRAVNKGLMTILNDQTARLVLACVDYLLPIYQKVNDYQNLHPANVSGNPEQEEPGALQKKAWATVAPVFRAAREEQWTRFGEMVSTARTASQLADILPAAVAGKVDVLFLENKQEVYGAFDEQSQDLRRDNSKQPDNSALLNLAAIKTFEQGGRVYLLEPEEMPVKGAVACAIFRY